MSETTTENAIVSGAFVLWDVGATSHELLRHELELIGLEKFCPAPRSINSALKKSLSDFAAEERKSLPKNDTKNDVIVQTHKKRDDGFEVVRVARGTTENDYAPLFSAKIGVYQEGRVESVEITKGYADVFPLATAYNAYRREVTGSEVGRALVEILNHLHGTCVRTIGGVYFLPEDSVAKWDEVVTAFEAAGPNTVHRVRIVMDEQAIRTVKTAISRELTKRATALAEEITTGNLSPECLETRKREAQALRERAREYEGILSTELAECHAIITTAETAASSSTAMQDDSVLFDDMYAS